jgi:DNA-binding XRE family transcriptional regulator
MGILAKTAAKEIGVSANSFGYWERGERVPRPEHLRVYYSQLYRWQEAIDQLA